ncbi:dehydroquinate synthase/iron-containing alcohol dehydrogenase family protein [Paraburkholderia agricolaris]|uniref:iron-containing alcohol dehydrogenase n=1 Tax=Paraburkholderia agricolaris TaxID=2152888 RepID=UPI0038BA4C53
MGVMNNGMSIMGIGVDYQQVIEGIMLPKAVRKGRKPCHVAHGGGGYSLARQRPARREEEQQGQSCAQRILYGAWLCGMVLGNVGMALYHKLCHTLGGTFNLPHAETHAIVLPHSLAYNSTVADEAMGRIARTLNVDSAPEGLYQLIEELGVPRSLREIGLSDSDLDYACGVALSNPYWNPRPIEEEPLRALLQRAWEGGHPAA